MSVPPGADRFAPAMAVADAVVYEGYVLYPYRASSPKNHCRWQFGVLVPPGWRERDPHERTACRTECVARVGQGPVTIALRVRALHLQRRSFRVATDAGGWIPVETVTVGGTDLVGWDEAVEGVFDLPAVTVGRSGRTTTERTVDLPGSTEAERAVTDDGRRAAILRTRAPVHGQIRLETSWADEDRRLLKVAAIVENTTNWTDRAARREEMTRHALVAAHAMLAINGGEFVSSLTPSPEARDAVAGCHCEGTFPVLANPTGPDDLVLSSPIILYDHPAVAAQSLGDLYDATEIDEILSLRVLTLTPEEKAAARALDPRAAAVVDRCEAMAPDAWASLHGTVRTVGGASRTGASRTGASRTVEEGGLPSPAPPLRIDGVDLAEGSRVILRPSRRADAQDLFVAGQPATVVQILEDVGGVDQWVAVTLDEDPASDLLSWHRRYLYFHPDEIEPIPATGADRIVLAAGEGAGPATRSIGQSGGSAGEVRS